MAKIARAAVWHIEGAKYGPAIQIELRPDKKRIVLRQGENEVWIDCADVKVVTNGMIEATTEARLNHVVGAEDSDA